MLRNLIRKVVKDPNQRELERLQPIVDEINALEPEYEKLTDAQLRAKTDEFRQRLAQGETLDDLLPEAFAAVREASKRTIGLRHYDVQLLGGIVLHQGKIAEMKTGEGKTLVATLPLYLNALTGRGVHLVTVNDYLARRDGGWMGPIFHLLGLSVGLVIHDFSGLYDPDYVDPGGHLEDERLVHWRPCSRQEAYAADVTYGTNNEFGFDYLRDNLATDIRQCVQREFYYAIVDEVDNILIDEARTPLIISGPAEQATEEYHRFAQLVRHLKRNTAPEDAEPNGDFDIDERTRTITLTERGIARVERLLMDQGVLKEGESIYDPQHFVLTHYLENALKAQYIFHRDRDYVVMDGRVILVDEHTGRLMPGRRYSEGLHQAIEAKEGVHVRRENVTLATITFQNFFRMYEKLAGMTGTAATEAEEFHQIYGLDVVVIPTNVEYMASRPDTNLVPVKERRDGTEVVIYEDQDHPGQPVFFKRIDYPDQIYKTEEAKYRAVVEEIKAMHEQGRPVLVGTTSVENSERLSRMLKKAGIPHQVLNAKHHRREAAIVAQAGRPGAVTVATSMAGRGTDILLGGNPEGLAAERMAERCFTRDDLIKLARQLFAGDEEGARKLARQNSKLSPDLVDWLLETRQRYEAVIEEIERYELTGFLARQLQAPPYAMDYNDALTLVRMVRDGDLEAARSLARERTGSVEVIAQVEQWLSDYQRYQHARRSPQDQARFIAGKLFEQHYNARAALIRAVLAGDQERAEQLVAETPGLSRDLIQEVRQIKAQCEADRRRVWEAGGLHVIGTERHEARRIDNQLRGRAARQGDPGSSRFYLSLEDELMRRFGGQSVSNLMERFKLDEDIPLEHRLVDKVIESSQQRVEGYHFDIRKNLVEYDDVVNRQREIVYRERRSVLEGSGGDLDAKIREFFAAEIEILLDRYLEGFLPWIQAQIAQAVQEHTNLETGAVNVGPVIARLRPLLPPELPLDREVLAAMDADALMDYLNGLAEEAARTDYPLRLLVQEIARFIPLWPSPPYVLNLRTAAQRAQVQRAYTEQVHAIFEALTGAHLPEEERAALWQQTEEALHDTFSRFAIERASAQERPKQQALLAHQLNAIVGQMLQQALAVLDREQLQEAFVAHVQRELDRWREQIGDEDLRAYERLLVLQVIDREWQQYLEAIEDLRQGIGLEAFAQRDPKVEFKRRAFEMFDELRESVRRNIVDAFFAGLPRHQQFLQEQRERAMLRQQALQAHYRIEQRGKGAVKGTTLRRDVRKVGRNDPCPCGSGKKYKHCHGRLDRPSMTTDVVMEQPPSPTSQDGSPSPARSTRSSRRKRRRRRRR